MSPASERAAGAAGDESRSRALGVGDSLRADPADLLVRTAFRAELEAQAQLAPALSLVDLADTLALLEAGSIPADPGARLLRELLALHHDPTVVPLDPGLGDLYTNREAALTRRDADAAGWLGAGRARREATTVAFHLIVRDRLVALGRALADAAEALVELAERERATLVPDYTYLQPAQPTTVGHWLLGFLPALRRDDERIANVLVRVNRSPAGIGSGNGSIIHRDRARIAELLGFDGLAEHARDAVWAPDLALEVAVVATAAALNLDRLAEDLLIFASEPFGFVELADEHARASRVLPQKRNPFALTHIRAVANRAIGASATVAAAGRMPTGQPDARSVPTGEIPLLFDAVTGAAELMAVTLRSIRVDAERCRAALDRSGASAGDVASLLVLHAGLDFRSAHRVCARLAREVATAGRPLASATPAELAAAAEATLGRPIALAPELLGRALDPRAALELRGGPGGASAADLSEQLAAGRTHAAAAADHWRAVAARSAATMEQTLTAARARAREG